MALNLPPLVTGGLSILPAAAIFFFAFNRYEGHFKDQTVFLFFMGGLGLGALLSLFAVFFGETGGLLFVLVVPLLYAIAPTAVLNRRKWQGNPHAVFNGGALGLGIATMTTFAFSYRALTPTLSWRIAGEWALLAFALAGVLYAAGLLLGSGVADRTPIRVALIAALGTAVLFLVLNEYLSGGAFLWVVAALAIGVGAAAYGSARVMPLGLTPEARATMRRDARKRAA